MIRTEREPGLLPPPLPGPALNSSPAKKFNRMLMTVQHDHFVRSRWTLVTSSEDSWRLPPRTGRHGKTKRLGEIPRTLLTFLARQVSQLGDNGNWSACVREQAARARGRTTHAAPLASIGLSGRTDPPGVVSRSALSALVVGGGVLIAVLAGRSVGRSVGRLVG